MGRSGQSSRTSAQQRRIPAEAVGAAVSELMRETNGKIDPAEANRRLADKLAVPRYDTVLYHGTSLRAAAAIREQGFRAGAGGVIFATSFREEAESYAAGGDIVPVRVQLSNPLVVGQDESLVDVLARYGLKPDPSPAGQRQMARVLAEAGFDGLVKRFPEDNRDPSDRYPAREWARIFTADAVAPVEPVRVEGGGRESFTLTPGLIDGMAVGAFAQGQCHALALALHERTGWPVIVLEDDEADAIHFAVQTPDGRALDITGCHDLEEFQEGWGAAYLEPDPDGYRAANAHRSGSFRTPRTDVADLFVGPVMEYVDGSRPNLCAPDFDQVCELAERDATPLETIEITDGNQAIQVQRGVLDENARKAFAEIQPHGLAGAILLALPQEKRTEWKVCRVVGEGDWSEEETLHVFMLTPDGRALDANGLHDPAELARTHGGEVEELGHHYRSLSNALDEDDWTGIDIDAAVSFVEPLLAEAGYTL